MRSTRFISVSLSLFSACLLAAPTLAQGPAMASAPHKELSRDVGVWDAEGTFWMNPGAPPIKSQCVETNKMLGTMWLVSEFKGDFAGMPFTGHAQIGYDPADKKYIGTWIDTMSPYMGQMKGDYDATTHTLTMVATGKNMETGEIEISTNVTKYIDQDTKVFTIHSGKPGDKDAWKMMEIKYKRRK